MARFLVVVALFAFSLASVAVAHPLSPASLELHEQAPAQYRVSFRRPRLFASVLLLDLPSDCRPANERELGDGDALVRHFELTCGMPLDGRTLRVFGLAELSLGAVVHARFLDGSTAQALLGPHESSLRLPKKSAPTEVFVDYLAHGALHLVTGYDHVLFVLGLLFLVRGLLRTLVTLTAFTLGHSMTLCLSALSWVELPEGPVELGIALSIVALAFELTRTRTRPAANASLFVAVASMGLLHGLGFAGALAETGLPSHALPLSLAAFNLGVELGQVAIVLALTPFIWAVKRHATTHEPRVRMAVAYGIGSLAAMWSIERALFIVGFV